MGLDPREVRSVLRLTSALVMLTFVVCHLTAHCVLLISIDRAQRVLDVLMGPWRTTAGTIVLATALLAHYSNALWSIYVRRHLRWSRWEAWQLGLGLCIPALLMTHVIGTRVAQLALGTDSYYTSVLVIQWVVAPWVGIVQMVAVLTCLLYTSDAADD